MARIERVAVEIMDGCKDYKYFINYYKVQRLAYICQCVHYAMFNVPLSPEKIYFFINGGEFKELYNFFDKKFNLEPSISFVNDDIINHLTEQSDKYGDLFLYEKKIIDFVVNKYGNKELDELIKLTLEDSLFEEINIGDVIFLDKLNNLFITEEEKKYLQFNEFVENRNKIHKKVLKNTTN